MTSTESKYYRALRRTWKEPAMKALRLARERARAEQLGITFDWEPEQDNPRDVFGDPSYYECDSCGAVCYSRDDLGPCCDEPRVKLIDTGVYYNPNTEYYSCVARGPERQVLDSLGMIEAAWSRTDYAGYWFMIECEMSGEALRELDSIIASAPEFDLEETLP
jgi:hypothetical protein